MAIISVVKMLASVGNLYSFFVGLEINAQLEPVIFFDASVLIRLKCWKFEFMFIKI